MKINNLLDLQTSDALREWLDENHNKEKECWVIVSIKPKADTLLYLDVVEEALCFGWIDGIKKKISETQLAQRLSPRTKRSSWTELNKERIRRLDKQGRLTVSGRRVLPDMRIECFKVDDFINERLKENQEVYDNYNKLPDLYKRIRISTIQSEKKNNELYIKRLNKFIENTKNNKMYGKWNDDGRLLNY